MKFTSKKSIIGGFIALILGSSCCWLTSLAVWFGGASVLTAVVSFMTKAQVYFILLGAGLLAWAVFLFLRSRGCCPFLNP